MIGILDYGVGNLFSVKKAFDYLGEPALIVQSPSELDALDRLLIPGVGAFGDAMELLHERDLVTAIQAFAASNRPLLGICLGMQLLFDASTEHGDHAGLGLLPGRVERIPGPHKIPQVGWNQLTPTRRHPLTRSLEGEAYAYFVHSYYVRVADDSILLATAEYGVDVPAIVAQKNIVGMQFHPEKSSNTGLKLLKQFAVYPDQNRLVSDDTRSKASV
ncbi:imidazole glycerol phosphate synthase subunit HisH [Ferroacidibacillus organovorans]|uniref:Imidazole glycerol phosphate synthase subunit HisH n=1 Tax=Ferroacidibacillus organovorans TaxID=1765683 RepID=A0A124IVW0_9BACL|nr:imidazole glycerol phosphate synthase subunit HisH [Ferroacidibacillus organovorans]KUO95449.1 imidazole glycerol phosphate synthase subunit HisH [Ferroacidibacillus organovorans]